MLFSSLSPTALTHQWSGYSFFLAVVNLQRAAGRTIQATGSSESTPEDLLVSLLIGVQLGSFRLRIETSTVGNGNDQDKNFGEWRISFGEEMRNGFGPSGIDHDC